LLTHVTPAIQPRHVPPAECGRLCVLPVAITVLTVISLVVAVRAVAAGTPLGTATLVSVVGFLVVCLTDHPMRSTGWRPHGGRCSGWPLP
jgi:hypothetical protein